MRANPELMPGQRVQTRAGLNPRIGPQRSRQHQGKCRSPCMRRAIRRGRRWLARLPHRSVQARPGSAHPTHVAVICERLGRFGDHGKEQSVPLAKQPRVGSRLMPAPLWR